MVMSNPKPVCNQTAEQKLLPPARLFRPDASSEPSAEEVYYVCAQQNGTSPITLTRFEVVTTNLQIIAKAAKNRLGRATANADDFDPIVLVSIANNNNVHLAVSTRISTV